MSTPTSSPQRGLHQLTEVVRLCYKRVSDILPTLPKDRNGQLQLVAILKEYLEDNSISLGLSSQFLSEVIGIKDRGLLKSFDGGPEQTSWLMAHEELSNFFAKFLMLTTDVRPYIIHHLPKTAGTSLYHLILDQRNFIYFPQTDFAEMCRLYDVFGFATQLHLFENDFRTDRFYIGGHFNLPEMIDRLNLYGAVRGVSLCRAPEVILSSGIRYVWTQIEQQGLPFAQLYGFDEHEAFSFADVRRQVAGSEQKALGASLVLKLLQSNQFRYEYDEIYVKYFYGSNVRTPGQLWDFLFGCGQLYVSLNPVADVARITSALDIEGHLPHVNASALSSDSLSFLLDGHDNISLLARERYQESRKIFQVISAYNRAVTEDSERANSFAD